MGRCFSAMSAIPLLEFKQICFSHTTSHALLTPTTRVPAPFISANPVLNEINFTLYAGEKLALIGANGSGKTTLLQLILGLLKPQRGEIIAFGRSRHTEADFWEVRLRIGLVFQEADDQLFCPTVAEDIAFGLFNMGKSREDVRQGVQHTLALVGLQGYEQRITHHLSGGEKRLVALATVLAMQPDILLLDEPTTGLDERAQQRIIQLLQNLPQAMLISSHDRLFLQQVTQAALHLQNGQLQRKDI